MSVSQHWVLQMSNNGYSASQGLAVGNYHRLGSPFVRGSFTGDGITASQRFPVRERYILAYRE